jgi:hypothetical protein
MQTKKLVTFLIAAVGLLVVPLFAQQFGNGPVRIIDLALLYVLLALGLNIVVGYAGLLDLGYVAFYAVGSYLFALMASPHLSENFEAFRAAFPTGLHSPLWIVIPLAAGVAALFGVALGAPTLKLRGDYLAIVTLGFGEIIRVFLNNLEYPVNVTNGPRGIGQIDSFRFFGIDLGRPLQIGEYTLPSVTLYYYLFLALVVGSVVICYRLVAHRARLDGHPRGRDRRQGDGHQHPQHEAAGLRHGRHLRRRGRRDVRELPGLRVARVLQPAGVGHDRRDGGAGWHRPHPRRHPRRADAGGAARGAALCRRRHPEPHRRPHRRIHPAPAAGGVGDDHHHADPSARPVAGARAWQGGSGPREVRKAP